jgi:hypothetical protein
MQIVPSRKIIKLSDSILLARTMLILYKHKINKSEYSVQKYLAEREFEIVDKFISGIELEFGMYKYIISHVKDIDVV